MKPIDFDIEQVIQSLQGTCNTLDSALPEGMTIDDLTEDDHEKIDSEIFCCETCGWWCEMCEQSEDSENCTDCNSEGEE